MKKKAHLHLDHCRDQPCSACIKHFGTSAGFEYARVESLKGGIDISSLRPTFSTSMSGRILDAPGTFPSTSTTNTSLSLISSSPISSGGPSFSASSATSSKFDSFQNASDAASVLSKGSRTQDNARLSVSELR